MKEKQQVTSNGKVVMRDSHVGEGTLQHVVGILLAFAAVVGVAFILHSMFNPSHAGDEPHTETVIVAPVPDHQISVMEQQLEAGAVESEQAEEVLPDFPIGATSEFLVCVSDVFTLSSHFDLSFSDRLVFLKMMVSVCRQYNSLGDDITEQEAADIFMQQIDLATQLNLL